MALSLGIFCSKEARGVPNFQYLCQRQNPARNLPILHLPYRQAAVLVAIAIPVFTSQLERSREATDIANVRSAYAEVMTNYLVEEDATFTIDVSSKQGLDGWQGDKGVLVYQTNGKQSDYDIPAAGPGKTYTVGVTVSATDGSVTPNITVN